MKKSRSLLITFIFVGILFSSSSLVAYGYRNQDYQNSPSNITEAEAGSDLLQSNITTQSEPDSQTAQTNSNYQELERSVEMNEKLFDLYGTWTSVIAIAFAVLGVIIPLYYTKKIDQKIKNAISDFKKESEALNQKQLSINNALMLSASKDYWTSNKILYKVLEKNKKDTYLHLLIGRNIFFQYTQEFTNQISNDEQAEEVEKGVEHFLFVADNINTESEYYDLGSVFPNSIVHELCVLMNKLIDYSLEYQYSPNYHKLTSKVIKSIEKMLDIKTFDDIANQEQSSVYLMHYKDINHALAKSYKHFGNIKAKEQYEYALKLYTISNELDYKTAIKDCLDNLNLL